MVLKSITSFLWAELWRLEKSPHCQLEKPKSVVKGDLSLPLYEKTDFLIILLCWHVLGNVEK